MRFATLSRPGIGSPFRLGPAVAAGIISLMGFYGFATSVQRAASLRASTANHASAERDDARAAIALGPMPSLTYAVTEGSPFMLAAAEPPRAQAQRPAAPVIASEPVAVSLVSQPLPEAPSQTIEVATSGALPQPAPNAADQSTDAAAIERPPTEPSTPG